MNARRLALSLAALAFAGCASKDVKLTRIVVSPETAFLSRGTSMRFVATGVYSDGTVRDVSAEVAWAVTDRVVAELDSGAAPGTVRGLAPGTARVSARKGWISGSRTLQVRDATITALEASPPSPVVPVGVPQQLRLVAVFTDSTAREVTAEAAWTVDGAGAQLSPTQAGLVTGLAVGTARVVASFEGARIEIPLQVTDATVERIEIAPQAVRLPVGTARRLSATATLSDFSVLDVTESATWKSSAADVAFAATLAGERGTVSGRAVGEATISATLAGVTASTTVTVTAAQLLSVELTPATPTLPVGFTQRFALTGVYDDDSVVDLTQAATWGSSAPWIAEVIAAGQVRALGAGAASVKATVQGHEASTTFTVTTATLASLDVQPARPSVAQGTWRTLAAVGTFSDGASVDLTEQALWASDAPQVASVSNIPGQRGLLRGLSTGEAGVSVVIGTVTGRTRATVTPAALERVEVGPPDVQLPMGLSQPLRATGVFSDGSTQDLTATAAWSSSSPSVASVSNAGAARGEVSALSVGSAQVRATVGSLFGVVSVTVTSATLRAISVAPAAVTLPSGGVAQLTATGIYTDDSTRDLTAEVAWTSDEPLVATVSNAAGAEGQVRGVGLGATVVEASAQGFSARVPVTVTAAQLVSLEIAPASMTLAAGLTRALTAVGTYSDATVQDLTDQVSWSSSAPAVAQVSNLGATRGVVTALAVGAATVCATLGGVQASAALTVSPAYLVGITLTPAAPSMPLGTSRQLTATGTYSDASTQDITGQVSFSSSDEVVAWVSPTGEVRARAQGTATVAAVLGGVSGSTPVTVTPAAWVGLEVSPVSPSTPLGTTLAFTATGRFSDGSAVDVTAQATWESLSPAIAAVSTASGSAGVATGLAQGTATIRATHNGRAATATLTVTPPVLASIAVSPSPLRLAAGTLGQLSATGTWTDGTTSDVSAQVAWTSSDAAVVAVSNAATTRGWATAGAPGAATVTATLGTKSGQAPVTVTNAVATGVAVTPALPSAPAGLTRALQATATFSDGTTQDVTQLAAWTSSDASRALVSDTAGTKGVVTGVAVGTPTITASALGRAGQVTFTVTDALLVSLAVTPAAQAAPLGTTPQLAAMGTFSDGSTRDVSEQAAWTSSAPAIAAPSNAAGQRGRVTTLAQGAATITAAVGAVQAQATVTVTAAVVASVALTPPTPSLPLGTSQALVATATWTDGTTQDVTGLATFASSNEALATVSNATGTHGLVQSVAMGTATVSATFSGVTGQIPVAVTPASLVSVGVTPVSASLPAGRSQQLVATGVYTDSSTRDLTTTATWTSSDVTRVTVSNAAGTQGQVTALAVGTATVTATVGGVSGAAAITATPAVLQAVQVTPVQPSIPLGLHRQLTATGVYSDGSTLELTTSASWASSDAAVLAVSMAAGHEGEAQALAQGSAVVSATVQGFTGTTQVTVTPAVLQQLQVTPANVSTPKGFTQQLTATGVYSDATTQDVTGQVTWASSPAGVVSISNAVGTQGLATALDVGTATVSASLGGVTGSTPFTVTPAVLVSVAIVPPTIAATVGTVRALTAIGTYSDASTQVVTTQAAWSVADGAVAFVSNAPGTQGLLTTLSAGATTVSAQVGAVTGQAALTVTQATLISIDLAPAFASTPLGFTRQFIAFGTYSNGATQILTQQVTWSSSDPTKAIISNAAGSQGLLSTVGVGAVTVTASYQGVTGTTPHTVSAAVLVGLVATPPTATIAPGADVQLTATGVFSDGSQQPLTDAVTWTSSAPAVAQVSNAAGSEGLVTGIAAGGAVITAAQGAVSATAAVTVQ